MRVGLSTGSQQLLSKAALGGLIAAQGPGQRSNLNLTQRSSRGPSRRSYLGLLCYLILRVALLRHCLLLVDAEIPLDRRNPLRVFLRRSSTKIAFGRHPFFETREAFEDVLGGLIYRSSLYHTYHRQRLMQKVRD
jgi:hypothetical protein